MNLFALTNTQSPETETFTTLLRKDNIHIEHISSNMSKAGEWYLEAHDEWILLLQGEAKLEYSNGETDYLIQGDTLLIKENIKHRVASTSTNALWLAIHLL